MTDVERWPDWTPSVTRVDRLESTQPFGMGSRTKIVQPGLRSMVWSVTQFEPNRGFVWEASGVGAHVRGEHWISPGPGGCSVIPRVEIRGLLEPLLRPWLTKMARKNVDLEAPGLKRRCESLAKPAA